MGRKTKGELKRLIDFYVRNLRNAGLATDDELASVAKSYKRNGTKDDLWAWLGELKSLTRLRKAGAKRQGTSDRADALEAAIAALEGRAETVHLASIDKTVRVTPASWARIMIVEDLSWWVARLAMYHMVLTDDDEKARDQAEQDDPDRGLDELMERVVSEISHQRRRLYAQITAPSPRPVEDAEVEWADDITPVEDMALLQAWHRVNLDLLANMPEPTSKDGKRKLPLHWAFVFQSVAWRERRPPEEIVRDRSLVSIVASTVLEAIRSESADGKGRRYVDQDTVAEALGIDA